jgi:Flp pilus assembly protein TadD
MVELRRGALVSAVSHLSTASALAPDDATILSELGIAFLRQGKIKMAVRYFEAAIKGGLQDETNRYYLYVARKQLQEDVKDRGEHKDTETRSE